MITRPRYTVDKYDSQLKGTSTWNSTTGSFNNSLSVLLPTNNNCVGPKDGKDTGQQHLVLSNLDLRDNGVETGRLSFRFQMMLSSAPITQAGAGGFTILQWGVSGVNGTLTLSYVPVSNYGGDVPPHSLIAAISGDVARIVTVPIYECDRFIQVFLEYDGTVLTLVVGQAADQYVGSSNIPPAPSPNTLLFAADIQHMYFMDLQIFNAALIEQVTPTATSFPYMLWDSDDSGVIATIPTPTIPDDYFVFLDRGYTAGHAPAEFNLTTSDILTSVALIVNERQVPLAFGGGNLASFLSWLTTNSVISFPYDGKTESLKATVVGNTVSLAHKRGSTIGQMSFSVAFDGRKAGNAKVTGGHWGLTRAVLGKIPQQWALPHTGEPNRGISILGANNSMATPKSISVEYRDDNIRTAGKVIGNLANRPGAGLALTRLSPTNFFGSNKAPFPKDSIVYGNPNGLAYNMSDMSVYAYGLLWERYLNVVPSDVGMKAMPYNRSRAGDTIAAFSIDIPLGQTLRAVNINFTAAPPGVRGNAVTEKKFCYDWGEGARQFPFVLTGNSEYTCLFYPLIAVDADATEWRTIPSIGTDAVKVAGANVWKELVFRATDFENLLDKNGLPLLMGSRRVHFKLVLAHELTHVTYQGMSYRMQHVPKK